ncbi:MAG: hypothetical protein R2712_14795 [Vicinamibacterales bacterium]
MADHPANAWRAPLRGRLTTLAAVFALWALAVVVRLFFLQVLEHDDLVARAERQQQRVVTTVAKRGAITDRHGRLLAYSVDTDTIYAVPSDIQDPEEVAARLCQALDRCDRSEQRALVTRLSKDREFAYVRRRVTPREAQKVAALGYDFIGFLRESKRFYPNRELASHLLGFVGIDDEGLGRGRGHLRRGRARA